MADTPSKIRRKGYKAYRPDMLQAEANPYNWVSHPGTWENFREGWMKAERDFVNDSPTPLADSFPAMEETHVQGYLTIENILTVQGKVDLGIQIADDGRVWICVDGQAFLRFKPIK